MNDKTVKALILVADFLVLAFACFQLVACGLIIDRARRDPAFTVTELIPVTGLSLAIALSFLIIMSVFIALLIKDHKPRATANGNFVTLIVLAVLMMLGGVTGAISMDALTAAISFLVMLVATGGAVMCKLYHRRLSMAVAESTLPAIPTDGGAVNMQQK